MKKLIPAVVHILAISHNDPDADRMRTAASALVAVQFSRDYVLQETFEPMTFVISVGAL